MNRQSLTLFQWSFSDIKKKKYEVKTQTSVDNTVNDLGYEFKFKNCMKEKNNFFIKRNIAFLS